MEIINAPAIICVSGLKNAGKTTCIESVLPLLVNKGLQVAVIKHDGHDFEADVRGTDTYRHKQAGAYGTAIFSKSKYMVVKEEEEPTISQLVHYFPEADIILVEGLKYSSYPKIEIIRSDNSTVMSCNQDTVIAYVSDIQVSTNKKVFGLNHYAELAEFIVTFYRKERELYGKSRSDMHK